MSEKMKFFKVIIFIRDEVNLDPQTAVGQTRQMEILLPVDAIAHLTPQEPGNPRTLYQVHFKKSYLADAPFPVKSTSTVYLSNDQVELLK